MPNKYRPSVVGAILNDLKEYRHNQKFHPLTKNAIDNRRYIPRETYSLLKSKRFCQKCGKKFSHPLGIHHILPVSRGGTNELDNLMAVCDSCHEKLDEAEGV